MSALNRKSSNSGLGRVGWLCSYTPEEIILAAGFQPYRLLPLGDTAASATDKLLPPTLCPYVRQVARNLESGAYGDLKGLVIANSCNAMIHLYSVLEDHREMFVYLLDLPRRRDAAAEVYFSDRLAEMARFLSWQGSEVSQASLIEAINLYRETGRRLQSLLGDGKTALTGAASRQLYELAVQAATMPRNKFNEYLSSITTRDGAGDSLIAAPPGLPSILLTGAIPGGGLVDLLSRRNDFAVYQENCISSRYFSFSYHQMEAGMTASTKGLLQLIARVYLHKPPCPRSFNQGAHEREQLYRNMLLQVNPKGVLFHDLSFCDLNHYDYLVLDGLLAEFKIPLLKLKTELGQADLGQIQTRVEAFLEMIA